MVARVFGVLILVVLLAAVVGYVFVSRTLPTTSGRVVVPGLEESVQVVRDRWGVPHISAATQHDVFFTQGYVSAQDRLWQMEWNRRLGAGRLSEIFGNTTFDSDVYLRTLGLRRVAAVEEAQLDPEVRDILEAYAAGVNSFIETHRAALPIEFTILGFEPEPWHVIDSLTWGKVIALDLGGNFRRELLRASLIARFGEAATRELLPGYPSDAPLIVPAGVSSSGLEALLGWVGHAEATVGLGGPVIGSDNWVISASRTATGKPFLVNDPHLGIQMPSIWYEVHLQGAGWDVVGASFPGFPGVIVGHNRDIAWGVTNVGPDVQDLYIEQLNPDNPRQVLFQGRWQDMQVSSEEVRVKGQADPERISVYTSPHGPLLQTAVKGIGQSLALRWTALEPSQLVSGVLQLDRAHDWPTFRNSLRAFDVPSQNFVYADTQGNIGYQVPGRIPIRARGDGLMPVPGWTGEYEWIGWIPYDQLPSMFNPPTGTIATANNRIVDDNYPYMISSEWDPGFRARRILGLLGEKDRLSADDMQRIQTDEISLSAPTITRPLLTVSPSDEPSRRALALLDGWDGRMGADSPAAAVYQVTYNHLLWNLFEDEMGTDIYDQYRGEDEFHVLAIADLLSNPRAAWWTQVRGPAREGPRQVMLRSLREAVDDLTSRFGSDQHTWRWGRLHTATFEHPLGVMSPLDRLFNLGPFERGGSGDTLNNTGFTYASESYAEVTVASLREVIDLADLDRSLFVITTGESGQPFSRHMADQSELWQRGQYHPLPFTSQAIHQLADTTLDLLPPNEQTISTSPRV